MKTTFAAIAFFVVTIFSANAQENQNKKHQQNQTNQTQRDQTQTQQNQAQDDQYVRDHTDRMSQDLGLNEDQTRRLEQQNRTLYNNNRTLDNNTNMSDAERNRMQQNYQDRYDQELEGILSDDQYERYESDRDRYNMQTENRPDRNRNNNRSGGTSK